MTKTTLAAALALAAMLPLNASSAFAETIENQAALCAEAPLKAAKAGIDCSTTSSLSIKKEDKTGKYPSGPVNFGNGIVF